MRVFLCVYKDFSVAIPMSGISSLFLYTEETMQNEAVVFNPQTQDYLVSLFFLFNLQPEVTRHGIILKNETSNEKIILLSTRVDCEIETPDSRIFPIPKIINGMLFSNFFSGIQFNNDTESKPVLLLNPEQLIKYIKGIKHD
jgi:hypothetical protein